MSQTTPVSRFRLFFIEHAKLVLVVALSLAWIIPGLVGHEPWKPDEAYSFGLVYHIVQTGDWVVPTLAGEPFMEKPPFYYIAAALMAKAFSPLLPLHDAARLTSGLFIGLTLILTGLTARELLGRGKGRLAALVLLGCVGLLVRGHEMITDTALLAGFAAAFYGLALSLRRPVLAGVVLGTGVGMGFLSKGLIAPGIVGLVAVLLLLFKPWRVRNYFLALAVALAAVLPWLLVWPYALYQRSPALFMEWFWTNNLGRYFGFAQLGPTPDRGYYLETLPWFAWPAWPIALWALWRAGVKSLNQPAFQLPLVAFFVILAVLLSASDAREVYALPILLPLAILAGGGVDGLRRGAASALDWFGLMTFGLFAGFLWLGWVAMMTGWPAKLTERVYHLQPAYVSEFKTFAVAVAAVYTVLWLVLVSRFGRSNRRAVVNWAAGITLMWGLLTTLWLPWIDTGKSYKAMVAEFKAVLPPSYDCVASQSLGEPQRAMLHYYVGILTQRDPAKAKECDLLLVQGGRESPPKLGKQWRQIWDGARPGDRYEHFWLFQKKR